MCAFCMQLPLILGAGVWQQQHVSFQGSSMNEWVRLWCLQSGAAVAHNHCTKYDLFMAGSTHENEIQWSFCTRIARNIYDPRYFPCQWIKCQFQKLVVEYALITAKWNSQAIHSGSNGHYYYPGNNTMVINNSFKHQVLIGLSNPTPIYFCFKKNRENTVQVQLPAPPWP